MAYQLKPFTDESGVLFASAYARVEELTYRAIPGSRNADGNEELQLLTLLRVYASKNAQQTGGKPLASIGDLLVVLRRSIDPTLFDALLGGALPTNATTPEDMIRAIVYSILNTHPELRPALLVGATNA